jgi:hypothetical protein
LIQTEYRLFLLILSTNNITPKNIINATLAGPQLKKKILELKKKPSNPRQIPSQAVSARQLVSA